MNLLVLRGQLTSSLGGASHSGEHGLKSIPGLLRRVRDKHAWERRIVIETGEEFEGFFCFQEYVEADPPKGLGADMDTLKRLVADDEELSVWIQAEERKSHPNGGDRKSREAREKISFDNIKTGFEKSKLPTGTSKAYALQKLSDEGRIDLLEQVKAKKISAHEAMRQAGYRFPKIAIRLDNPVSAAKTLLTHASPGFLSELKRLLSE